MERRGRAETIFWRFSSDTRERDGAGGAGCEVGELMICDKPLSLLPLLPCGKNLSLSQRILSS